MKQALSFICGMIVVAIAGASAFGAGKIALVNHVEYSGDGPSYLYQGQIDPKCSMTTYTTKNSVHQKITAYSVYTPGQIAGGSVITSRGNMSPEVVLWNDDGSSMNNQFHKIIPVLDKVVSKNNNASIACLAEAKVDKSNW